MARGSAHPGGALTITIRLSRSALTALQAGTHESVKVTVTATDANGTDTATVTITRLKGIRT